MIYLLVCLLVMVQVKPVSADQRPEYTVHWGSTPISVDRSWLNWSGFPRLMWAHLYFPSTNQETRNS